MVTFDLLIIKGFILKSDRTLKHGGGGIPSSCFRHTICTRILWAKTQRYEVMKLDSPACLPVKLL